MNVKQESIFGVTKKTNRQFIELWQLEVDEERASGQFMDFCEFLRSIPPFIRSNMSQM